MDRIYSLASTEEKRHRKTTDTDIQKNNRFMKNVWIN